jgi:hypothetical protein
MIERFFKSDLPFENDKLRLTLDAFKKLTGWLDSDYQAGLSVQIWKRKIAEARSGNLHN